MNKYPKCYYCSKPLSETDSVFININRFDKEMIRSSKSIMMCCKCWDRVKILIDERCEDCKHAYDNPATTPCRFCGHCYISQFEEDKANDQPDNKGS